jgi:O-antigen/teichoic acid export membrane protein
VRERVRLHRSLKANLAANVAGRGYTALCGIFFVPIYLHFLGVESYGLFALLNSYMAVALLLDIGFSAAMTREIARLSEPSPERMRDLVWTISLPYCAGTFAVAFAIYLTAPWLASVILHESRNLHQPALVRGVGFAGFALTLQLPVFLFTGGLAGLQRQDLGNGVTIASTTLRHGGNVFLLWSLSSSVANLMIWQGVVAGLTAIVAFAVLWRHLPPNRRWPRFRLALLRDIWRFAAGIGGVTLIGMIVFQSDKMFAGALLPLKEVGIYMVASVIGANLIMIAQPVSAVAFPRLSQLQARKDAIAIRATLHKLSQFVALMVLPLATTIAFFPQQTLTVWTGNPLVSAAAAPVLRILAVGVACNACSCLPYCMILAAGRTRLLFLLSSAISALVLPSLYFLTSRFGAIGTAIAMLGYQALWLILCVALLRSLTERREWWRWISVDALLPQLVILLVDTTAAAIVPRGGPRDVLFLALAVTWFAGVVTAGLAMPSAREQALRYLHRLRRRSFRPAG